MSRILKTVTVRDLISFLVLLVLPVLGWPPKVDENVVIKETQKEGRVTNVLEPLFEQEQPVYYVQVAGEINDYHLEALQKPNTTNPKHDQPHDVSKSASHEKTTPIEGEETQKHRRRAEKSLTKSKQRTHRSQYPKGSHVFYRNAGRPEYSKFIVTDTQEINGKWIYILHKGEDFYENVHSDTTLSNSVKVPELLLDRNMELEMWYKWDKPGSAKMKTLYKKDRTHLKVALKNRDKYGLTSKQRRILVEIKRLEARIKHTKHYYARSMVELTDVKYPMYVHDKGAQQWNWSITSEFDCARNCGADEWLNLGTKLNRQGHWWDVRLKKSETRRATYQDILQRLREARRKPAKHRKDDKSSN